MSHSSEPRSPAKRLLIAVLALAASMLLLTACQNDDKTPIKVGVLHSLTGTMAISEQPVVDATLLAIEEINARGGLLGRKIVPVIVDGKSDWPTFAREAERLIIAEKVSAIFGCWTSASRKSVKPVVEKHQNILFYPVQYEGLEQSTNIIYGGQSANQQIIPAVKWSLNHLGKRFFLVGSDYIFPYIANAIITDQLTAMGVKVAGEAYLPLGSSDTQPLIDIIIAAKPDVILNTINGDSNIAFFKALRAAGISSDKIPTLSFSIAEPEAQQLGGLIAGDYASWSYFQTIDSPENSAFVSRFKARYGNQRVISDPMQAAYTNVMIWADTVSAIDSSTPVSVLSNIKHQHRNTATGIVYQDQM
ncbi:MAG: urea ABC transporter substrate-binding protein, partial [Zetaproteobacteria bacterium CG_4_9_14_3_um_filter_53_7]